MGGYTMADPYDILKGIPAPTSGSYEPSWSSLRNYRVPSWFIDSKLGIFIHWGVYSVPAYGSEWYPRHMYMPGRPEYDFHTRNFGTPKDFGYKDFVPMFTAENWDPDDWAELFEKAGVRFVVPVAEHHDGYTLWDSRYTRWCASKIGPKRDIIGELKSAVERRGLLFGVSYHRAEHWWFFEPGTRIDSDVNDPRYMDLYGPAKPASTDPRAPPGPDNVPPDDGFLKDWLLRIVEVVEKYRPILVYFDWWIANPAFEPYLKAFAAYYYNRAESWGEEPVIIYKHGAFPDGTAIPDLAERGTIVKLRSTPWLADTSVDYRSWGYIRDAEYKSPEDIVWHMVDVVSKNGVFLLNVGPRSDGTIPEEQRKVLAGIGGWLRVYGEAVYGTRTWKTYGEGTTRLAKGGFFTERRVKFVEGDVRYTVRDVYPAGSILYAIHPLASNGSRTITLRSLAKVLRLIDEDEEVVDVDMLGSKEKPSWSCEDEGVKIQVADQAVKGITVSRIVIRRSGDAM
ncbi:MAG: alpha-L-fucosidase [Nitrososphaerota archaeon]|nr:alpha-L-fucosidase [Candidatus Bathyarchaeota archaeon]MCX8162433.1 alpha-L-fucosidase [Candidatus Bathyarchaeota archaeon]MDW8061198.1 alpha-L-fucosidase [Nitrososphaerota archaeon]